MKVPLHHIGRLHHESLFFLYFCFGNAIGNDRRLKLKTIEGRGIHFVYHCRTYQLIELATRKEFNHNKKNIKK